MTNKINIIFDNSDLHIQENLNSKNIKIFFGIQENIKPKCNNIWEEIDGDIVDLDCSCSNNWTEIDGDIVDLNLDCNIDGAECDYFWKPLDPSESIDFSCLCPSVWDDSTNDFNINCEKEDTTTELGRIKIDSGEGVRFEIHGLEIYYASSGEFITTDLNINKTVFDIMESSSGETLLTQLYRDRELDFNIVDGQSIYSDIKYIEELNFESKSEIGEIVDIVLNVEDSLTFDVHNNDQIINLELETFPSATLEFEAKDGNYLEINHLTSSVIFASNTDVGEDILFELDKPFNPNIESLTEIGEYVDLVLNTESSFNTYIPNGDAVDFDLSVPQSLFPVSYEIGEYVNITMYESQNHTFNVNYEIGEILEDLKLSTETGFIVDIIEGQTMYSNIEYDPYTGLPVDIECGEALNVELYRSRVFYPNIIDVGENLNITLTDYPYLKIKTKSEIGESVIFNLFADVRLGEFKTNIGENLQLNKLNELENYEVEVGEYSEFLLSTAMTAKPDTIYQGEKLNISVKEVGPVNLLFDVVSGENTNFEVKSLKTYSFSVKFSVGERLYPNDWINEPILIDLDDRKCCDIVLGDLKHIQMELAPYNHTSYEQAFSMCELVTFDLSSRHALSFNMASGEYFNYNNTLNTFEFNIIEGHQIEVSNFRTTPIIELEDGNQTPENPVIDIDRPDIQSELDYIMMGIGERAKASLSASFSLNNTDYEIGEFLKCEILTNPPFRFTTWVGERADVVLNTTMQIPANFNVGEQIQIRMYEPGYTASSGEEMICEIETKTDYYAEFVTEGCLNNDYHDIDPESGQPLPQEYNGTSVEGELFSKYIVGRCF